MAYRIEKPPEQEGIMAWCLEKIDANPKDKVGVERLFGYARRELDGERLEVVEETAAWAMGLKRKKTRRRR